MPPKRRAGRPRKSLPEKRTQSSENVNSVTEAPQNDTILSETLIAEEPESQNHTLPPESQPENVTITQNVFVVPETLVNGEGMVDDGGDDLTKGLSLESGEKEFAMVSCSNNKCVDEKGKAKKIVKKTVKVVKKVVKKVPKKAVTPEIASTTDEPDTVDGSKSTIPVEVNAEESEPTGVNAQLQDEEAEAHEKKDGVEETQGGTVETRISEMMEVNDNNEGNGNNVGNVEVRDVEGLELGVGDEGKEKEKEGEEDVSGRDEEVREGKLFRGELEAMERRKRRKTEVFVGGLDKDTQEEDLRNVFAEAGEIVDLRLVRSSRTGKKFAFLRYASADDAKKALEKFAKVEICGKECGATPVEGNDTIFLGNIDRKWKDEDVLKLLNTIGIDKIDMVTVMIDPNRGCNRGFAFVEFETIKDAQVAYSKLQKKDVFGKNHSLKVAWAEPLKELDEEEMMKVKTVYAEFIPTSWDEEKVRDTFKQFGEIDEIVLARNLRTSKRKDFAFIRYKTREAAIKCIDSFSLELKWEDGTKVKVKVSLAKPASKRKDKPVAKEVLQANPKTSHSNFRLSEPRNWTKPSAPRYPVQVPQMPSTNVELVQLLREQASWRPPHSSLSISPMDIHYDHLTGRKRQFSSLETDLLSGEFNRYPRSRLDASHSIASSSHNTMPPSGLANPLTYQRHSGYPSGSLYGTRHNASNDQLRDLGHERNFLSRRY